MSLPIDHLRDVTAPIAPAELRRLLAGTALTAMRSLFRDYGVVMDTYGVQRTAPDRAATLFTLVPVAGRGLSGTVVLGASQGPLRRSMPSKASERDWLAELGNQLTGRIKNELSRLGIALQPALPVVVAGGRLTWSGRGEYLFWNMDTVDGVVSVGVDVSAPEPITPDPVLLSWDVPLEGEALLF